MGFKINHPELELELKFVEVDKLHIHEEVLPDAMKKLVEGIKGDSLVKHPVIVDGKSLVVLDGMHRVASIKKLGYRLMLVCCVDYESDSVRVERWFRILEGESEKPLTDVLADAGYELKEASLDEIEVLMKDRKAIAGLLTTEGYSVVLGPKGSIKEIYDQIGGIEKTLANAGYKIGYGTDKDAMKKLENGEAPVVLAVPAITKKEIVDTALANQVFIPKATRHLIPARPMSVDAPIKWLTFDPGEANELLEKHLSKKKIDHLPPGEVLDRRYDEELYIFK